MEGMARNAEGERNTESSEAEGSSDVSGGLRRFRREALCG